MRIHNTYEYMCDNPIKPDLRYYEDSGVRVVRDWRVEDTVNTDTQQTAKPENVFNITRNEECRDELRYVVSVVRPSGGIDLLSRKL